MKETESKKTIFLSNVRLVTYCGQYITINDQLDINKLQLIDKNSKPVTIHKITKCKNDVIQIIPNKGITFTCGVNTSIQVKNCIRNNNSIVNIDVNKCNQMNDTLKQFNKKLKLVRCKSLEWNSITTLIHPYIHGLYTSKNSLILSSKDLDIIKRVDELGKLQPPDKTFYINKENNYITSKNGWLTSHFKNIYTISKNDIRFEKEIPIEYVTNTKENIKEYLAGLLDGNIGHIKQDMYTVDITCRSNLFLEAISLMFRSCGFLVTFKDTNLLRYSNKKQRIEQKLRIFASGELTEIPSIKCEKIINKRKIIRDWNITYFTTGFHEEVEGYLLEIDSEASVLTEDFFVLS